MTLSAYINTLRESLSCCTYNGAQHSFLIIKEADVSATFKKVTINIGNGDWFSFAPDKGRGKSAKMSPLLATGATHKHHCACDCVVVYSSENQVIITYIDLKSGNPSGYIAQFKSTRQFMRYSIGLLEEFYGIQLTQFKERYVIIHDAKKISMNKMTTKPKMNINASSPERAYFKPIHNDATIYFKEFLV